MNDKVPLRDWYAGLVLQALETNPDHRFDPIATPAYCFDIADRMMKARETQPPVPQTDAANWP